MSGDFFRGRYRLPGTFAKPDRNAEIVAAVARGEAKRAIARRLGISAARVRRICVAWAKGEVAAGWARLRAE